MLELKETDHSYYCSDSNYYVGNYNGENWGRVEYETWEDFKDEWLGDDLRIDRDYNLCFRYDITRGRDVDTDELLDEYHLYLYFILQRKGIFRPVFIKRITKNDLGEIEIFLKNMWDYHRSQWEEVTSNTDVVEKHIAELEETIEKSKVKVRSIFEGVIRDQKYNRNEEQFTAAARACSAVGISIEEQIAIERDLVCQMRDSTYESESSTHKP